MIRSLLQSFQIASHQYLKCQQNVLIWKYTVGHPFCSKVQCDDHSNGNESCDKPVHHKWKPLNEHHRYIGETFMANLSPELLEKKKRIEFEWQILGEEQEMVPKHISAYQWKDLLTSCDSSISVAKHLRFLAIKELAKEADRIQFKLDKTNESDPNSSKEYLLTSSSDQNKRDRLFKLNGGIRSLVLGQPIVIDFDYNIKDREQKESFKQLIFLYGYNNKHDSPMHIYITGVAKNYKIMELIESGQAKGYSMDFHTENFYDIFPKERLVMLSADGPRLQEYNGNDIYVIGGLADFPNNYLKASYSKAKKLGIRCGSLPLTQFCKRKISTIGVLTINCVFNIMADLNVHHDWRQAFRDHLPKGFIITDDDSYSAMNEPANKMENLEWWSTKHMASQKCSKEANIKYFKENHKSVDRMIRKEGK